MALTLQQVRDVQSGTVYRSWATINSNNVKMFAGYDGSDYWVTQIKFTTTTAIKTLSLSLYADTNNTDTSHRLKWGISSSETQQMNNRGNSAAGTVCGTFWFNNGVYSKHTSTSGTLNLPAGTYYLSIWNGTAGYGDFCKLMSYTNYPIELTQTDATTYSITEYHYARTTAGTWSHLQTKTATVLAGATYKPTYTTATIPTGNTTSGSNFHYWTAGHETSLGSGTTNSTSITVNQNIVIEVYYPLITYAVTYDANGGTGAPSAQTKTYGVALTLSTTVPTKASTTANGHTVTFNGNGGTASASSATATDTTSHTFSTWNTNSSGTGTSYASGASYTDNAALTLYAQYTSSITKGSVTTPTASKPASTATRTVTFNANGGTCSISSLNSTASVTYPCKGWYTAASGGTQRATAGGSYTPASNETLYAQWNSSTGNYTAIILPTPTRAGYKFMGWATSSTATSGITGSYTPTGSITLYATWEAQGLVYIHDGTNFNKYQIYIYDGTTWNAYAPYIYNGTEWELYS